MHGLYSKHLKILLLFSTLAPGAARGQATGLPAPTPASDTSYAPVRLEGRTLFDVMGANGLSAEERANRIIRRLNSLIARNEPVRPFDNQDIDHQGNRTQVNLGGESIVNVTDSDAQDALLTRDELALLWGGKMALAVSDARAARANPLRGAGILIRNSVIDLVRSMLSWLPRLAGALLLFVVVWLTAAGLRWLVHMGVSRTHFDSNMRQLTKALVFYGTWAVGIVAILSTLGLEGASIATTLGISGFVLGFAFKDILSHFFAGIMLLVGRQFHIGDQIVVKDQEGTVERIELRALYLRTYDNRLVIIPNGDVFTSTVTSNTASPHRRREFVVGIGYDDDIEAAQRLALDTMLDTPGILQNPAPDVLVDELASSTVNLKLRFYLNSSRADYLKVGSECMRRIKHAFDLASISMPTDIQTIYIKNFESGWGEGTGGRGGGRPTDEERPRAA